MVNAFPFARLSVSLPLLSICRPRHDAVGRFTCLLPKPPPNAMEEKNRRERLFEPAEARSSKSTENVCVCVRVFASSHFFLKTMPLPISASSSSLASRRGASSLSLRPSAVAPVASSTGRRCAEAFACSAAGRRSARGFGSSSSPPAMTSLVSPSAAAAMPRTRSRATTPRVVCHVSRFF